MELFRASLMKFTNAKYPSQARERLAGVTRITSGLDNIITIEVDDKDPKHAADLANAYVEELYKLTQTLAVTEASQRRLFFEKQLKLAKQYEIAKADEARDASIVQVLDKAVEPERKSKPKRTLIVLLTALVFGFIAVLWAFIKEAGAKARQNPQQAERLNLLRRYLRGN